MFLNSSTFDLFDSVIRLRDGRTVQAGTRASLADADSPAEWIVAAFHADSDQAVHPDVWERHPSGQELLCVLSGALHVYLRDLGDDTRPAATVTAGESFVIPTGRWHRLSVVEPGDLLAITPPAGTQHERVSGHQNRGKD
jgi:mannose-6-phosphate isomerase-like protein (cupin superfamily)